MTQNDDKEAEWREQINNFLFLLLVCHPARRSVTNLQLRLLTDSFRLIDVSIQHPTQSFLLAIPVVSYLRDNGFAEPPHKSLHLDPLDAPRAPQTFA